MNVINSIGGSLMETLETSLDSLRVPGSPFAHDAVGDWFVLHTKSRQEKALASDLDQLKLQCFLPLVEQLRYHGRRRARIAEPLFPGYVFFRGTLDNAYRADRTKRLANIINVSDQKGLELELMNLALALHQKVTLDPYPFLKTGRRVQVRSGPLRGMLGLVEERLTWDRLILTVNTLGQAVSLEIDGSLLEPVD